MYLTPKGDGGSQGNVPYDGCSDIEKFAKNVREVRGKQ